MSLPPRISSFWHAIRIILEHILTRLASLERERIVLLAFFVLGSIILTTTFRYTVFQYTYWKTLADHQQTIEVRNPVSRGNILSNNTPPGSFATSTSLPDLAVDPNQIGSKESLIRFLSEIVYDETCQNTQADCYVNLLGFLRETDIPDYHYDETFLRNIIAKKITDRLTKKYVDYVVITENVSDHDCAELGLWNTPGLTCHDGSLSADPTQITDPKGTADRIHTLLNVPLQDVDDALQLRAVRYAKIYHRLSARMREKIETRIETEKDDIKKGLLAEADSIHNFLILEMHPTRFYPEHDVGGQITGFVDNGGIGHYGIEGYFNEELKGTEGSRIVQKDVAGRILGGDSLENKNFSNGIDFGLTIDRNVQKEITKILSDSIAEYKANKGSVVVMDPNTWAIIAMVNSPDYDPNNFGEVYKMEKVSYAKYPDPTFSFLGMPLFVEDSINGTEYVVGDHRLLLRQATENEVGNPAIPKYKYVNNFGPGTYVNDSIGSLYEPWSVFKAITVAIGLDTGDIRPQDMYTDKGYVDIDQYTIKNVDHECTGYHSYLHALNWSCNVGMIDIVQKIGRSLFSKYINDFWFGDKSNITLDGEVYGHIDPYEKWSRVKLFNMSFGQGIVVTPLQMATAYSVLANGGVYMQPYIVDHEVRADGTVTKTQPQPVRRVISEETSKKIIAMLTEGVRVGFAKKGGVPGYDIAGKTGTSQIASKGSYEVGTVGHTIVSFGGFAPSTNPKFVIIVTIDRPRTAIYSESTSSVTFSKVAAYLLNYYGIPKSHMASDLPSGSDN